MILWLKLGGILLGVLARTFVPFLRKMKEGKILEFSGKYALSSLASAVLGIIVTLLIFPQFEAPSTGADLDGMIKLFSASFGFGFGWNAIINEVVKWSGAFE